MKAFIIIMMATLCVTATNAQTPNFAAPKIDLLNYVYAYTEDSIIQLEKQLANMKTKMKVFGMGGADVVIEMEGKTSTVQLAQKDATAFLIKTGGETPPVLILYKLKVSKNTRIATTAKYGVIKGAKGSEGGITVNISKLDSGIFKLLPATTLEKGEYFFMNRDLSNAGTNSEVFAFTVL